jgi:hypothetical protein
MKKVSVFLAVFVLAFNIASSAQSITYNIPGSKNLTCDEGIFDAYKQLYNRPPFPFEGNKMLYNNGVWRNNQELKTYVQDFQNSLSNQRITLKTAFINQTNNSLVGLFLDGKQIAAQVISHNGGALIGNDGASIISDKSGGLIGQDGSSIAFKNMPQVSFGSSSSYKLQSGKVIKTSGKGVLVIK